MAIERRNKEDRDDYTGEKEISYFIYPLAYTIPGIGSGEGGGGTIVNLLGDGSTLNLLRISGEMEIDSIVATDIPLFTEHITLSLVYADGRKGGFSFYGRGPDSPPEPEFTLKFEQTIGRGAELSLKFFDKQLELYSGFALAFPLINLEESDLGGEITKLEELSPEEQEQELATFVKNFLKYIDLVKIFVQRNGILIDYTDDRIDPRVGLRLQYEEYGFEGEGLTNFMVKDYSLTAYIPSDDLSSVWVANFFYSKSEVTKPMEYDGDNFMDECFKAAEEDDKENEKISVETVCRGIQRGIVDFIETEANNSNSTALGGPNRLRSYPVARYHDKYSFFAGLEYRLYFLERSTPFNFFLEKGVFEAAQLALFHEIGQVSPEDDSSLYRDFKSSTGFGLRLVFSSVVLRADFAIGAEGEETTIFVGYGF